MPCLCARSGVDGSIGVSGKEALNVEEDGDLEEDAKDPVGRGVPEVIGSSLGKKVELISPIPTKKSSNWKSGSRVHIIKNKLTRDDLDKVRTPLPHISSVIDNDHHTCIARK